MTLSSGQVLRPKLLVGADGVNSKVRSVLHPNTPSGACSPVSPVPELPAHVNLTCEWAEVVVSVPRIADVDKASLCLFVGHKGARHSPDSLLWACWNQVFFSH